MVHSAYLGLPGKLMDVGHVLKVKDLKDPAGTNLINFFCKPCKPTKKNGGRTRNLPEHDPEKWKQFKNYCIGDVDSEYAIKQVLKKFPMPDREKYLYYLDQKINDRGIGIDLSLVDKALILGDQHQKECSKFIYNVTGVENPNSYTQMKKWLEDNGVQVISMDKERITNLLTLKDIPDCIKEVLKKRQLIGKTYGNKYDAIRRSHINKRIFGMLGFYKARTGRWNSSIVQVHNLTTTGDDNYDLEGNRNLLKNGMKVDDELPDTLSKLVRTMFIPMKGKKFLIVDFSAIEARVLAWLADEEWRLDLFAESGKIYETTAAKIFNKNIDEITKDSKERKVGKVAELALGYQGGLGALRSMEKSTHTNLDMSDDELTNVKEVWRLHNTNICQFWYDCQEAFTSAIMGYDSPVRYVNFRKGPGCVFIDLPSGRHLTYIQPSIKYDEKFERDGIVYNGMMSQPKKWGEIRTYGGKIVENITQAVARDCLAEVLIRVKAKNVVMHVHDEIVFEIPENSEIGEYMKYFESPIPWAEGLPLSADGYFSSFYKK
jgi:DNA polymerase